MKSTALPAWYYRNPEDICDGLIALSARLRREEAKKPQAMPKKDRYYTQSRSIEISAMVDYRKNNGGGSWK